LVHGVQVLLGHPGDQVHHGVYWFTENELPRLLYVSREKKPGFQHHTKAGALNALVRTCVCVVQHQQYAVMGLLFSSVLSL
jgi:hypothetical protein